MALGDAGSFRLGHERSGVVPAFHASLDSDVPFDFAKEEV